MTYRKPPAVSSSDRIEYLFLSDLHLGEAISVLTPLDAEGAVDARRPPRTLEQLVAALGDLLERNQADAKPTVVFAGDLLGMAYATMTEVLTLFGSLARMFAGPDDGICKDVIYVPGNHDHHVWEMARESGFIARLRRAGADVELPAVFHTSGLTPDAAEQAPMLEAMLGRDSDAAETGVRVVYPNLALRGQDGRRCVVVHHGHFYEPHYHFIGDGLKILYPEREPLETVEAIEAVNFAWIDFIWSALGRSGGADNDLESLFLMLRHPQALEKRAKTFALNIAPHVDLPYLPFEWLERILIETVITRVGGVATGERANRAEVCGRKTLDGLQSFLFGPTWRQLESEFGDVPDDVALIWGHTHKPFEKLLPARIDRPAVAAYNLGGWTVDYPEPSPHRGASIVLANADLDLAVLRVYSDAEGGGELLCKVVPPPEGVPATRFSDHVAELVETQNRESDSWQRLGKLIGDALSLRHSRYRENSLG